jgi:hypothetical protein
VPLPPQLDVHVGDHIQILVDLLDNAPPSNITVSQDGNPVIFCQHIMVCRGYVSYAQAGRDGMIEIQIDPDIQGSPTVIMKQPVSITGGFQCLWNAYANRYILTKS